MILVLGLDALDPDLIRRFEARMPTLSGLRSTGWSGRLRSTFPPVSVPAWSTFLTGVGPGRHGLFDFTRLDGRRLRFQNGADRAVPTLLEIADRAGLRVCALGVPTTYPVPRLVRGAVMAGFDSPFSGRPDARALAPSGLWERVHREGLDLRPITIPEGRKRAAWHRRAAAGILAAIDRRTEQALRLLREGPWDLFLVHYQAADTAGHHFMRYLDPESPRYDASKPDRARVIPEVYAALDRSLDRLLAAADPSGVAVLSDHGMGPASDRVCHLNRWLEDQGFLVRRPGSGRRTLGARLDWAGALRSAAIRHLPPTLQAALFRLLREGPAARLEGIARLGTIDLDRSAAFSEESSTLPGIWVLDPIRLEDVLVRLRRWDAVVRVYRREDLYRGPLRRRAPDLLLELRHQAVRTPPGYRGPAVRRLVGRELDGERGAGLNGVHRPDGVLVLSGSAFPGSGRLDGAWIGDLAPTLLGVLGVPAPACMEGRRLVVGAAPPCGASVEPRGEAPAVREPGPPAMSAAEAARLERRLRALGYLG